MDDALTLQQYIDRLLALPASARSLPVTWRSPATGACYDVGPTVTIAVRTLYIRTGRGRKATREEKEFVVIE
jgi:hypothetical protein